MKVSVIIPVYNVEKSVKECLESVLNQTLEEIEIICIHDAGEDTSFQIVRKMTAGDHRVCLIENKENIGLAATRNVGLLKSEHYQNAVGVLYTTFYYIMYLK